MEAPNLPMKGNAVSLGFKPMPSWGAWVAQSVKHPASAQVMISQFVSLSPRSGSVLTAQSLEPASDSVSLSLSLPLPHSHPVSLSRINKHLKNKIKCIKLKNGFGDTKSRVGPQDFLLSAQNDLTETLTDPCQNLTGVSLTLSLKQTSRISR